MRKRGTVNEAIPKTSLAYASGCQGFETTGSELLSRGSGKVEIERSFTLSLFAE